jgi:uncharacterized membrane protein YagU involved in acid resistance
MLQNSNFNTATYYAWNRLETNRFLTKYIFVSIFARKKLILSGKYPNQKLKTKWKSKIDATAVQIALCVVQVPHR